MKRKLNEKWSERKRMHGWSPSIQIQTDQLAKKPSDSLTNSPFHKPFLSHHPTTVTICMLTTNKSWQLDLLCKFIILFLTAFQFLWSLFVILYYKSLFYSDLQLLWLSKYKIVHILRVSQKATITCPQKNVQIFRRVAVKSKMESMLYEDNIVLKHMFINNSWWPLTRRQSAREKRWWVHSSIFCGRWKMKSKCDKCQFIDQSNPILSPIVF